MKVEFKIHYNLIVVLLDFYLCSLVHKQKFDFTTGPFICSIVG